MQPSDSECKAYELYTHLSELSSMWKTRLWPGWSNEEILRPALQGLELNFRMISSVLCDSRHYCNRAEWLRRLEVLVKLQLEIISSIVDGDLHAPVTKPSVSAGVLALNDGQEVWQRMGTRPLVSKSSRESLLPRLACWNKAEEVVASIHLAIECFFLRAPFTLGLGERNLSGKPVLDYDKICKPAQLYDCKQPIKDHPEDHMLSTVHQIAECWAFVTNGLVKRLEILLHQGDLEEATKKSWVVERVWNLISSTMDLLALIDPDDLMKLRHGLDMNTNFRTSADHSQRTYSSVVYCLRSNLLRTATRACKDLRHLVPMIVGVEADPKGGPRLQEAIMELFRTHALPVEASEATKKFGSNQANAVHVLQAFQAIEMATRKFYFAYQQLVISMMGSGGFKGSYQTEISASDALAQIYSEPPYFPSVDGAKTFLGNYWHYHHTVEQGSIIKELAQRASKSSSLCSSMSSESGEFSSGAGLSEESMAGSV